MFDVLVMAGGNSSEPLAEHEGLSNKAFILLNGKPMIAYILEALFSASSINKIVVVGPADHLTALHQERYPFTVVPEAGAMLDNASAGLRAVNSEKLCLVVTADIPLLEAATVEEFLKLCEPFDADFYYPILTQEICNSCFPDTKRTYVQLKEGTFTGGNAVLIRPGWFFANRHRLELFVANRKKPLKLLRMLSPVFVLKYLFRRLTIIDIERKLSQLLQVKAKAVPCDLLAIGTDVDKFSDLKVVRKVLSKDSDLGCR